jgi:hypothetical protein
MTRLALRDPQTRRSIEDAIERLVALLDQFDGEPDFEPANDDEPSIGWVERGPASPPIGDQSVHVAGDPAAVDLELDNSDWESGGDSEPSLGAPERHPHPHDCLRSSGSQERWADGSRGDHEREVDADIEQDHGEMPEDLMWSSDPNVPQDSATWVGR